MGYTLKELAETVSGEVAGNPERVVSGAAPFELAGPDQITYAGSVKFCRRIRETGAGAVIVPRDFFCDEKDLIRAASPEVAFARILSLLYPQPRPAPGIRPSARIGAGLTCGRDVAVGECAVVGEEVVFEDGVCIGAGCYIGDRVRIGTETVIQPNVTILEDCVIGARVIIHSGTVIGGDGFGYASDGKQHHKITHRGIVQIDDDVEIGSCNTIDRATFGRTWIQRGVKTDNLVHIAHNVQVGEGALLVAQTGISGSVTIGTRAILAGQAGVSQHLHIGDGAIVGPQSGLSKDVDAGDIVTGSPAMPHRTWLKVHSTLPRLPDLVKQVADLRRRLEAMEKQATGKSEEDPGENIPSE
jgi:UDP-3-O-[3-hydroxymyristoyl] glucosamine N-acyltransferase